MVEPHAGVGSGMLAALALMLMLALAPAAVPAGSDEDLGREIKRLGAADFPTREAATKALWEAGPAAIPLLETAVQSNDPEVAVRARRVLTWLRNGLGPDTPAEVVQTFERYQAGDGGQKQVAVADLVKLGAPARPVLEALAAAEPHLEKRLEIFEPALAALSDTVRPFLIEEEPSTNQLRQVLESLRLLTAILPEDPTLTLKVIERLDRLGRKKEADEFFAKAYEYQRQACQRFPGQADPHNNLAWFCALSHRRLEEGLALAEKATQLEPKNPAYLDTLAEVHFQKGNTARALDIMKQCIELDPDTDYYKAQLERFTKGDRTAPPPPAE